MGLGFGAGDWSTIAGRQVTQVRRFLVRRRERVHQINLILKFGKEWVFLNLFFAFQGLGFRIKGCWGVWGGGGGARLLIDLVTGAQSQVARSHRFAGSLSEEGSG